MNYISEWPEAYTLPNQESEIVAETLTENKISHFDISLQLRRVKICVVSIPSNLLNISFNIISNNLNLITNQF